MSDERRLNELMLEMERVAVDPNGFPAGISLGHHEALRVLRSLPDGAGPAAFLSAIREELSDGPGETV